MPTPPQNVQAWMDRGILVDPVDRSPLKRGEAEGQVLSERGATFWFAPTGAIQLLADSEAMMPYATASEGMSEEYAPVEALPWRRRLLRRFDTVLERLQERTTKGSAKSWRAFLSQFEGLSDDAVCLAVGGGPQRQHDRLVNLNIGPYENVEIVGDAHQLPFADASVDRVVIEAVLEHLQAPGVAAREIARVLRPGGRVYAATPFLQSYHGYPHHYQNYTVQGHAQLFLDAGLTILESGGCVGPVYMLTDITGNAISHFFPRPLNLICHRLYAVLAAGIRPLDRLLERHPGYDQMASTTYVLAEKVSAD